MRNPFRRLASLGGTTSDLGFAISAQSKYVDRSREVSVWRVVPLAELGFLTGRWHGSQASPRRRSSSGAGYTDLFVARKDIQVIVGKRRSLSSTVYNVPRSLGDCRKRIVLSCSPVQRAKA